MFALKTASISNPFIRAPDHRNGPPWPVLPFRALFCHESPEPFRLPSVCIKLCSPDFQMGQRLPSLQAVTRMANHRPAIATPSYSAKPTGRAMQLPTSRYLHPLALMRRHAALWRICRECGDTADTIYNSCCLVSGREILLETP